MYDFRDRNYDRTVFIRLASDLVYSISMRVFYNLYVFFTVFCRLKIETIRCDEMSERETERSTWPKCSNLGSQLEILIKSQMESITSTQSKTDLKSQMFNISVSGCGSYG